MGHEEAVTKAYNGVLQGCREVVLAKQGAHQRKRVEELVDAVSRLCEARIRLGVAEREEKLRKGGTE